MATFQDYAPELVGGVVGVTGHLIGKNLIDGLRRSFTSGGQAQLGDYFMDQSRVLLQNHLQLIELDERNRIRQSYQKSRKAKQDLNSHNGSQFQKLLQARKYRRISRKTFKVVKAASDRAVDDHLMNQMSDPIHPPGGGSGSGPGTVSVASNPFTDSHAISTLTNVPVEDLDRVEMSTYHVETTDEAAVVLDVVAQDKSVQHIVATFSTEAIPGDRTDREVSQSIAPEAPAALSLHREDGTMPCLVAASPLPDISRDKEVVSVNSTEVFGTSGSCSSPAPDNSDKLPLPRIP